MSTCGQHVFHNNRQSPWCIWRLWLYFSWRSFLQKWQEVYLLACSGCSLNCFLSFCKPGRGEKNIWMNHIWLQRMSQIMTWIMVKDKGRWKAEDGGILIHIPRSPLVFCLNVHVLNKDLISYMGPFSEHLATVLKIKIAQSLFDFFPPSFLPRL